MGGVAPLSPPVASARVETISSRASAPAVDDPADWSDIELGEPEDIEDLFVAPELPSPDVEMPSPVAPSASRSSVRTAYGLLRDGLGRSWQWLNGGPPDQTEPGDGPTSLPTADPPAPPSPMPVVGQERPSTGPAIPAASPRQGRSAAIPDGHIGVARPEASPALPRTVPGAVRPDAASAPSVVTSPASSAAPPPRPPRPGSWNPGLISNELRPLAGLYTRYILEHDGERSRAARTASIRAALGPDADRLEGFVRRHVGPARVGDGDAQLFLDQLTRRAERLRGANDKETAKLEDAEVKARGGRPVPVRPPRDPREGSTAERFLSAAFLTGRATRNVGLEQAAALAHAKRRDEEPARSRHMLECVSVWAGDEPSAAEAFRLAQPGQDRLSDGTAVPKAGWLSMLAKVYRDAFGVPLFDGGRGGVGGRAD